MATEEKIPEDEIKELTDSAEVDAVEDLVRACPPWSVSSSCHSYCDRTDRNLKRFLVYTEDERGYKRPTAVRWTDCSAQINLAGSQKENRLDVSIRHRFSSSAPDGNGRVAGL